MIKLCLIQLPNEALKNPRMYFPLGILYLAAVVRDAGLSVEIVDMRDGIKPMPEAEFYGFSCTTPEITMAKELAKKVKGITIVGGAHASVLPNDCVGNFDYVVRGEGEEVILNILSKKVSSQIITTPRIKGLDAIPYPAWDLVEGSPFSEELFPGERYGKAGKGMTVIGSRGCPYKCSFCLPQDTKVLTKDLRWMNIQDIKQGDNIVGVEKINGRYRLNGTIVLNAFHRKAMVYAIETEDGIVYSTEEHPWLMGKSFKSIKNFNDNKKYNASFNSSRAVLRKISPPQELLPLTDSYRMGYLSGAICGDGCIGLRKHARPYGRKLYEYMRMSLVGDYEMLYRAEEFGKDLGISLKLAKFNGGKIYPNCNKMIDCSKHLDAQKLKEWIDNPTPDSEYKRGFLAGIYDAEGSYSNSLRIHNNDLELKQRVCSYLSDYGFVGDIKEKHIDLHGGYSEAIRFLSFTQPCVTHKKLGFVGKQIHNSTKILKVYPVGQQDVYNLQTTTETFVADGFVTHNCANLFDAPISYRSVSNIMGELEELKKRGVEYIRFEDDNITIHPDFENLCLDIKKLGIHWKCHTRSRLLTLSKAEMMVWSGCEECGVGVESADDYVLSLNNKKETCADHIEAVQILHKVGLRAKTYFIAGLPGETDQTLELNKEFFRVVKPDKWTLSTFTPYPGSDIFNNNAKYGVTIKDWDYSKWWNFIDKGFVHSLAGQTDEELWQRYKMLYQWLREESWRH